ncbi:MAG: hypothetical protein KKC58_00165 [Gammaproteobacteria bacterium]|nr:hypothetical protein [Gammaproteobacteria bacterium]
MIRLLYCSQAKSDFSEEVLKEILLRILAKYSTDSSPKAPTIPGQRLHHFWLKYSTLSNHSRGCSH